MGDNSGSGKNQRPRQGQWTATATGISDQRQCRRLGRDKWPHRQDPLQVILEAKIWGIGHGDGGEVGR